jgi:hypothetical protein
MTIPENLCASGPLRLRLSLTKQTTGEDFAQEAKPGIKHIPRNPVKTKKTVQADGDSLFERSILL